MLIKLPRTLHGGPTVYRLNVGGGPTVDFSKKAVVYKREEEKKGRGTVAFGHVCSQRGNALLHSPLVFRVLLKKLNHPCGFCRGAAVT